MIKTTCKECRGRGYKPTSAGGGAPVVKVPCKVCMEEMRLLEKRINSMGHAYYAQVSTWVPKKDYISPN